MRYTIAWGAQEETINVEIPDEALVSWALEHVPSRTLGENTTEAARTVLAANPHLRRRLVAAYIAGRAVASAHERLSP